MVILAALAVIVAAGFAALYLRARARWQAATAERADCARKVADLAAVLATAPLTAFRWLAAEAPDALAYNEFLGRLSAEASTSRKRKPRAAARFARWATFSARH